MYHSLSFAEDNKLRPREVVTSGRIHTKSSFNKSKACESSWPTWQVSEIKEDQTESEETPQPITPNPSPPTHHPQPITPKPSPPTHHAQHRTLMTAIPYRKSYETRKCAICPSIFKVSTEECPEIQILPVCG